MSSFDFSLKPFMTTPSLPTATEIRWHSLLTQYAASDLSVRAFCQREAISPSSFYAWRTRLALRDATSSNAFIDGGFLNLSVTDQSNHPLAAPPAQPSHAVMPTFELKLDLGGGLLLHLVRS